MLSYCKVSARAAEEAQAQYIADLLDDEIEEQEAWARKEAEEDFWELHLADVIIAMIT